MMFLPQLALFFGLNLGLAALFALLFGPARPLARLALGLAAGFVLQFLLGFTIYAASLPWACFLILPASVAGLVGWRRRQIARLFEPAEVRGVLIGWLLLSGWSLCLHGLISSYSGGGWTGDQFEHFERASFFLYHWPRDHLFIGIAGLTARPPLANLLIAGWMSVGAGRFADFQVFSTLLSCCAFLPLALLVRRLGGGLNACAGLTVLLMLNPLWAQNTTFPWTKMVAAFFVLLAIERCAAGLPRARHHGVAVTLIAAGGLAHYSAGPWALALALAWLGATHRHWFRAAYWREIAWGGLAAAALTAVWLGWAAVNYGAGSLWGETSTARDATAHNATIFIREFSANFWHTFVPAMDSPVRDWIARQTSAWGRLRDMGFNLYQQTLPLGLGLGGLLLLAFGARPKRREARELRFWGVLVALVVPFSIASHASVVDMGMAHICLQPLVLLGIALNAAGLARTPRALGWLIAVALGIDLLLGIVLHFSVQRFWIPPWTTPSELVGSLNDTALINFNAKVYLNQPFFADLLSPTGLLPAASAALLLAIALGRLRSEAASRPTAQ